MSESSSVPTEREQLLNRLATLAYRRGDFTLASGRKSEHYVNCKPVSLSGSGLALISRAMLTHVEADAAGRGWAHPWSRPTGERCCHGRRRSRS